MIASVGLDSRSTPIGSGRWRGGAEETQAAQGSVVVHSCNDNGAVPSHEAITHAAVAMKLAALKAFAYLGEYHPSCRYPGPVYFVPSGTLVAEVARELGIRGEHDLFGGIVPHAFVATKAITHPLVAPDVHAPTGWSHGFARRVGNAVLSGFSAFTLGDARRAAESLLEQGPVRIKPARADGGRGQVVVVKRAELDAALDDIDTTEMSSYGLVLEENLTGVTTYSVGQVRVAELVATYYGTQRLTSDNSGATVYGGSELVLAQGDFDALLGLDLPEETRLAVAQARTYDAAAMQLFPGLFASRRNYDVARGVGPDGRQRSGVLEQSWRIGGASGAEVAALETFRAEPALQAVRASTVEIYGESEAPPHATVYFRGIDEQVGPITKYTLCEPYADAR